MKISRKKHSALHMAGEGACDINIPSSGYNLTPSGIDWLNCLTSHNLELLSNARFPNLPRTSIMGFPTGSSLRLPKLISDDNFESYEIFRYFSADGALNHSVYQSLLTAFMKIIRFRETNAEIPYSH